MKDYIIDAGFGGAFFFLLWLILLPVALIWAVVSHFRKK